MASNNPADSTGSIPRPYTHEDVIQQSLISFGQATDYLRVNRDAAQAVVDLMRDSIRHRRVHETWDIDAVQVLERVRAIGRAAALTAIQEGRSVIGRQDVDCASKMVVLASKTEKCPPMGTTSVSYPNRG